MADPTDNGNILDVSNIEESQAKVESYSDTVAKVGTTFDLAHAAISGFGDKLADLGNSASVGTAQFGLMSAALIKSTEAFRGFNNIDNTRVNSFTDQYKTLLNTIKSSPAGSTAAKVAIDLFSSSMEKAGASSVRIATAVGELKKGVFGTAQSFVTGADNSLYFQNALLQNAAAQGNMADLLDKTGQGFEHFNDVSQRAIEIMNASMGATNSTAKEMQSYQDVLKELPGGFDNFGESMNVAGQETTALTAAIQYMHGSGRDMVKIQDDMSRAMNEYGMTFPNAVKYTSRMSEAADILHAKMEDVRNAVNSSADAFKFFVDGGVDVNDMTKGLADGMTMYEDRLKKIGVPIANAIEMTKALQANMSKMSIGQESLISQQTGGPGGGRGALQYERLMKEHPEEAMKKLDDTIRKLSGGKMVTEKQAEGSEAAFSQFTKQTMLIQSLTGVQDRQQAQRMSDAMASGKLDSSILRSDTAEIDKKAKAGQAVEQASTTQVSQMNIEAESVMLQGGNANLSTLQGAVAARTGKTGGIDGTGAGVATENQDKLKQYANKQTGTSPGHSDLFGDIKTTALNLPTSGIDSFNAFKESFKGGNKKDIEQKKNDFYTELNKVKDTSTDSKEIKAADHIMNKMKSLEIPIKENAISSLPTPQTKHVPDFGANFFKHGTSAGTQLAKTAEQAANPKEEKKVKTAATNPVSGTVKDNSPVPVTLVGSSITVNFTGKCPHCGTNIHTNEHASINNPASTKQS
jgi:hypothetical protein